MDKTPNELEQTDYAESQSLDYGAGLGGMAGTNYATTPLTGGPEMIGFAVTADLDAEYDENDEVEQTRQQIEETRTQMSSTIDAIQERLSPEHLVQQAKDTVHDATVGKATDMVTNAGDSVKGIGGTIVETIKENPIPAALAGVGLGWLIVSARKSGGSATPSYQSDDPRYGQGYGYDQPYGQYGQESPGMTGRARNAMGSVTEGAENAAGQVAGTVSDTVDQVQQTAGQFVGQAQQGMGQVGAQTEQRLQRAQSGFQQMLQQNPLGVAAGAVVAGMAVGLAVPETRKEDQLFGSTRDQLVDQAEHTVQEKAQQVQTVAEHAVSAATDAAKDAAQQSASDQGLTK